ncbi:MAG TPA: M28 family peptidase, partial [Jiangellaceae bacterium]|nr:M28 family peptidase [Jiangellaceae bacterium]
DGRSDYGPFIEVGIPAGGLFTGAEGIKTAEQAAIFGGTVGTQYDPCYHLSCDTVDNLSLTARDQMSDAAAHATISLAQSTEVIQRRAWQGQLQRQADRTADADDVHDPQLTSAARRHRS